MFDDSISYIPIATPKEAIFDLAPENLAKHPAIQKVNASVERAIFNFVKSLGIDPDTQEARFYVANNLTVERRGKRTLYLRKSDGHIVCQTELTFQVTQATITVSSRYLTPEDADGEN